MISRITLSLKSHREKYSDEDGLVNLRGVDENQFTTASPRGPGLPFNFNSRAARPDHSTMWQVTISTSTEPASPTTTSVGQPPVPAIPQQLSRVQRNDLEANQGSRTPRPAQLTLPESAWARSDFADVPSSGTLLLGVHDSQSHYDDYEMDELSSLSDH